MAVAAGGSSRKKKRSYDTAFKLNVVDYAENVTNRGSAAKLFVDEKTVLEWRQKKPACSCFQTKRKGVYGGCRKAADPDMAEVLFSWISDLRASNLRVTRTQIQQKAREISQGQGM